ncbi:MAG: hypothetical protein IKZ50_04845 [Bacteroidales bacterium]|nr:hypothetical protein [Bacteroidales bacterium]
MGQVIGDDGKNYATAAAATSAGHPAVAKIVYVGTTGHATYSHGLALALTDEANTMNWESAIDACSAKNTSNPVTGATWLLASKDQWEKMINAAGGYATLRDGFSSVGGTNMQQTRYWTSTESTASLAYYVIFTNGDITTSYKTMNTRSVRACLAF